MRDPQLISIEFQVAQLSKRIFCNSGKSYERYVQRFSNEIYFESKRRNSIEREMLIDTATKHGFDEALVQGLDDVDQCADANRYPLRHCQAVQTVQ